MIVYAVAFTLCTMLDKDNDQCSTYVIDLDTSWKTRRQCLNNGLRYQSQALAQIWEFPLQRDHWLQQYSIVPDGKITDYDFTCEAIELK